MRKTKEPDEMEKKREGFAFAVVHLVFLCVCADENFQNIHFMKKIFEDESCCEANSENMRNVHRVCSRARNAIAKTETKRSKMAE